MYLNIFIDISIFAKNITDYSMMNFMNNRVAILSNSWGNDTVTIASGMVILKRKCQ